MQILIGFLLGLIISLLARKAKALDDSGAIAATLTGGLIFAFGGLPWAAVLLTFFISSSLLSNFLSARKRTVGEKYSKSNKRDWAQVLANGGLGTLFVILNRFIPASPLPWLGFIGAMAAVNADTWSTELGVLAPSSPRLITNGKQVEAGTSGGISLVGTLASLLGAALIGLVAYIFSPTPSFLRIIGISSVAGLLGSLFDSLLGASIQAIYYCPACNKETEQHPFHQCGVKTRQIRGYQWLNNDMVNFLASLFGSGIAILLGVLIF
ncbi:MAG: DUF92 domain-containing protein [Anaerolineales bacterium]|nr:DUF92 domain-containing protein [Anaerolineales bacterium]HEY62778.1 DUF92 domain-containing protein [Anaerolineae bacterium]